MNARKDVKAVVQLAAIDHVKDLTPNEDVEDESTVPGTRFRRQPYFHKLKKVSLEFGLRRIATDRLQHFWSDKMQNHGDSSLV